MNLANLRLAVLGSISWPTPPPGYGPWEQIAYNIADGMRRRGADVTLFATGNSRFGTAAGETSGKLVSVVPVGLNEDAALNGDVFSALHIGELFRRAHEFDLIHNNFDWRPMTYALGAKAPPLLTTIHGFSNPQILAAYYACAERSFYCSISNADRDPGLDYLATTYNGIDPNEFTFNERPGDYLVFLGRFHPEKGAHLAIEIAKRAGVRIKLAAIQQDRAYFKEMIEPQIDGDRVQFLGPVEREARNELLSNALALVHMTTRPERFGLTMIEAMACGTPVLGAKMGSIPEIVIDGSVDASTEEIAATEIHSGSKAITRSATGFLCTTVEEAVAKVPLLASIDRRACRARVEAEFTVERMIDRYIDAYEKALRLKLPPPPSPEKLRARQHDWWDRPMAYTEIPEKPTSLRFEA